MAHEIKADSNTYIGYDYIQQKYYVRNLETTTYSGIIYNDIMHELVVNAATYVTYSMPLQKYTLYNREEPVFVIYRPADKDKEKTGYLQELKDAIDGCGNNDVSIEDLELMQVPKVVSSIKAVLDVAAPTNKVDIKSIWLLQEESEFLQNISFTWEDTGKYIKTIQFNTHKDYAIQYDEPYLYIKNSNEMWDMSSGLSISFIKDSLRKAYIDKLHLDIPEEIINIIVDYFHSLQQPYVYNEIQPREEITDLLKYTNKFYLNDYNNKSKGVYVGTKNPESVYTTDVYNVEKMGYDLEYTTIDVKYVQKSSKQIVLYRDADMSGLHAGDIIKLVGTYSSDGTYNIKELDYNFNIITLKDTDVINKDYYSPSDNPAKIILPDLPIEKQEKSITLTEEPHVKRGETMQLTGAVQLYNLTVQQVVGNKIYFNESISKVPSPVNCKLYSNSYSILKAGKDTYTQEKTTMQIKAMSGKTITLLGAGAQNAYVANEKIWIDNVAYDIESYTPSTSNTTTSNGTTSNTFVEAKIVTKTNVPSYTFKLGDEPKCIVLKSNYELEENTFTFEKLPNVYVGDVFEINNNDTLKGVYTVESIDTSKKKITVKMENDEKLPVYQYSTGEKAIAQIRTYSDRILLDMTYSRKAERMPIGEFMLDDDQQFTNYLKNYNITTPTSDNYGNFNMPVNSRKYLCDYEKQNVYMTCLGLYSEIYPEG